MALLTFFKHNTAFQGAHSMCNNGTKICRGMLSIFWLSLVMPTTALAVYAQLNLVSDVPGFAITTDANLVNPWGLVANANGSFQIANNGTGTSVSYFGNGTSASGTVIVIPGVPTGTPTGIVRNTTTSFNLPSTTTPATYLFAGENGTILAYNATVDPVNAIVVKTTPGAVYKGIAIASNGSSQFLYVTNFATNRVEVYDTGFNLVNSFTDPNVPAGYAPFGIRTIYNKLYVTYALQGVLPDDAPGLGHGYIDVFSPSGTLLQRLVSNGLLNSPWGMVVAPQDFGHIGGSLLVGNFGDGKIHAYRLCDGRYIEELKNIQNTPLVISGLWGLEASVNLHDNLVYFTAGPDEEGHGLFGKLRHVGNRPCSPCLSN